MRRCYVTRTRATNARQASFCTRQVAEQIWMLVQAKPRLLAETLRRKTVWTGALTTWSYSLQMSALGYIYRFLRKYQHSHQISVWSDWLKDALLRSGYVCQNAQIVFFRLRDTRLIGPAAASSAELGTRTRTRTRTRTTSTSSQQLSGGAHESCVWD